ncbi:MAG: hypothetical protein B7Z60_03170 [Ferrovum sp. 37-45-19]|jgi:LPS-assembly lipoprotein|uniref:LPS-assembly lipoprotein LptE n=1 Tax=Ferrovum sp. JA12 TaxID=1356299 RepID=UPI000703824A|nr:LPS assembly lipoprotein LptE [Ferrovum sp. JA12]OYV80498.1 MAG: hypothetical protein B7Z65_01240 [Ferrovum sp. 21-44-67]OYV94813.1 MAG: hypothetical protein B7Z60_03170 [Ferrovum sp. 37-45-19]OZB34154.1 MAG: hypothetical protein B7X47_02005 [Ferrovum sp. 34-44-207]HQT81060.1 LPS assembly lipoprotein LptE [Ferrovaceae bacterium]KRH79215.1 LPS-assembly lipoprotein LptE [Ferrovum sp. JA12]
MIKQIIIGFWVLVLLSSCGFQLRQPPQLHFKTIFIEGVLDSSIKRTVTSSLTVDEGLTIVKNPADAEVIVNISPPQATRQILSLNSQGLVSQYTLYMKLNFRAHDNEDNELLPPTQLVASRILKYSDAQIYASLQEEKSLNDDMRQDLVLQMLRRLSSINPKSVH